MAAKIEEPVSPSFERMIEVLEKIHSVTLKVRNVLNLEEDVIRTLDFSLRRVSATFFLERYLRLFGLNRANDLTKQIMSLALRKCLKIFAVSYGTFLETRAFTTNLWNIIENA